MVAYLMPLFLLYLAFVLGIKNKYLFMSICAYLVIFCCAGYMTGTDWRNYELMYLAMRIENDPKLFFSFSEPGFVIYCWGWIVLGIKFFPMLIISKTIAFLILICFFRKFLQRREFYLPMMLYLSLFGYYLFIDNPLRNMIAITWGLLAIWAFARDKQILAFLGICIACCFHFSAIILILVFWSNFHFIKNWVLIFLFIVVNIICIQSDLIFRVLNLLPISELISRKIEIYQFERIEGEGKVFSLGMLIHIFFFFWICLWRQEIEKRQYGHLIFNFAIFCPFIFRLGLTVTVLSRFQLYFAPLYVIAICHFFNIDSEKSLLRKNSLRFCGTFLLCLFSCCNVYSYASKTYRYIPYTNYFFYLNEDYDYQTRNLYNPLNSPYDEK